MTLRPPARAHRHGHPDRRRRRLGDRRLLGQPGRRRLDRRDPPVERCVNWVDTAAAYGHGHSEEVVGRAVRALPEGDRAYVFTKCGLVWEEGNRFAVPERVGRPESIRRGCEASLRRLGVERLDLLQIHWPPEDGTPPEEAWGALLDPEAEAKIRAGAVSNFSVTQLEAYEARRHVGSLEPRSRSSTVPR